MAANEKYRFQPVILSIACTDPAVPASGGPVRFGTLTGVAMIDETTDGNCSVDVGYDAFLLSVKGVDDNGNSAVAVGDNIFYVDGDTPKLSKKASGYFFGVALATVGSGSTATINVLHCASPGSGTLAAGTVNAAALATASVTAVKLSATLKTGYIPLDLTTARILSANAIQNTVEGGVGDGNTDPILARVNGATDIALRLSWVATSVVEIQFAPVSLPPDVDATASVIVNLMLSKTGNTDTAAVVAVKAFQGIGGSNLGGNTAALASATLAKKTVALTVAAAPSVLNIAIVPGTHANDTVFLSGAWIEYTRA